MKHSLGTITLVSLCILALLGVWGGYGWLVMQTTDLHASVIQQISDRDAAQQKITYSESLRSLLRDTANDRTTLSGLSTLSAVDIVGRVRTLGQDAGVDTTIDAITPATLDPSVAKTAPALSLTISASGTFAHLYHLVQLLETMPLGVVIDQVSLDHQPQGGKTSAWTLRVRVYVYTENAKTI